MQARAGISGCQKEGIAMASQDAARLHSLRQKTSRPGIGRLALQKMRES